MLEIAWGFGDGGDGARRAERHTPEGSGGAATRPEGAPRPDLARSN
jgi:hypothetical protein